MTISNSEFLVYGLLILIIFIFKNKVSDLIFDIFSIEVETKLISYFSAVLLIALLILGIFFNQGAGVLSMAFSDLEPKSSQKPHRYFDIQTVGKE